MEHNSKYSNSRENSHHYIPGNQNPKSFSSSTVNNIALNNKKSFKCTKLHKIHQCDLTVGIHVPSNVTHVGQRSMTYSKMNCNQNIDRRDRCRRFVYGIHHTHTFYIIQLITFIVCQSNNFGRIIVTFLQILCARQGIIILK